MISSGAGPRGVREVDAGEVDLDQVRALIPVRARQRIAAGFGESVDGIYLRSDNFALHSSCTGNIEMKLRDVRTSNF